MRTTSQVNPPQAVIVPMDPRIRRRRMEVRRDEGRRRLRLLVAVLLILTFTVAGWVAIRSPLLDVDRMQVEGADHTAATAIVHQAAVRGGQAMIDVDEGGAARRVETLPWIAHATVRRRWPSTVRITVTERRAVAVTRFDEPGGDSRWALLDATGRVLEIVPDPPGGIAVEGVGASAPAGAVVAGAKGPLEVVTALSPQLAARTTAVSVVDGGQIELKLNPRGIVRLGPPDDLKAKLTAVETVLARVDVRNLATLDVRLPSSPVLTRA